MIEMNLQTSAPPAISMMSFPHRGRRSKPAPDTFRWRAEKLHNRPQGLPVLEDSSTACAPAALPAV